MTEDDDTSSNIEWEQKKGFTEKKRISRRIDLQKALDAEARDRNNFKTTAKQVKNLPPNLKKLRTKINDVYDEDDDEDDNEIVFHFSMEDENSSLINALKEDEKSELQFKKTLENQQMQQTAGKMEALVMADKMSKQLGLKGLKRKIINDGIQDVTQNSETFNKAVKQNIAVKTKIKTENLSAKETADMVRGLRKMRRAASAADQNQDNLLENFKAEELVKIGKSKDDKKTAEIILEKSGRKETKHTHKQNRSKEQQKIKSAIKQAKTRE